MSETKVNSRPLKMVLNKVVRFSDTDLLPVFNLGYGDISTNKYLGTDADGKPVWKTVSGGGGGGNGYNPQGW